MPEVSFDVDHFQKSDQFRRIPNVPSGNLCRIDTAGKIKLNSFTFMLSPFSYPGLN